jgi:Flp pilus assembly pilin Flp
MDWLPDCRLHRSVRDDGGAALIEYTTLLGTLIVGVLFVIIAVGIWMSGQWTTLIGLLPP